jgi:hypothetical protein
LRAVLAADGLAADGLLAAGRPVDFLAVRRAEFFAVARFGRRAVVAGRRAALRRPAAVRFDADPLRPALFFAAVLFTVLLVARFAK